MSHPPGPPQDPYQPDPEPYAHPDPQWQPNPYADPTAPAPYQPDSPPPYGPSYPQTSGMPYPTYQPDPTTPMPPAGPYPTSGAPSPAYPPTSGAPHPPGGSYPPGPGGPYASGPGGPYPPAGPMPPGVAYPPGPYPGMPVPPGGKSNTKRTVVIVAVAALVLAVLCCVGGIAALVATSETESDDLAVDQPTPAATSAAPRVEPTTPAPRPTRTENEGETFNMMPGDTLVITDDEGTIEITITKFATTKKGCASYAPAPDEGMYLIAHVTAEVTKGRSTINPFFFEWVAANGTTANGAVGMLSGCGTPLASGLNLRSGSTRSGTVVFDVSDKNGVVEYQHSFETAGSWRP